MKKNKSFIAFFLTTALTISMPLSAYADEPGGTPPGGGQSVSSVTWSGATEITSSKSVSSPKYSSTTADQNSVLINTSGSVTLKSPTVTKSGNSSGGDNCNFYGVNSAVMVKGGGT